MKYCIDHCWQFLVFAIGFGFLIICVEKSIPKLTKFVVELAHLLTKELKPGKGKTIPELINARMLLGLFILALVAGILSALNLKHFWGGETGHIFLVAIIFFFVVCICSPMWLYVMEREKRIRKLTQIIPKDSFI